MKIEDTRKERLVAYLNSLAKGRPNLESSCWKKMLAICDWMFDENAVPHIDFKNDRRDNKIVFTRGRGEDRFMVIIPRVSCPALQFNKKIKPDMTGGPLWYDINGSKVDSLTAEEIKELIGKVVPISTKRGIENKSAKAQKTPMHELVKGIRESESIVDIDADKIANHEIDLKDVLTKRFAETIQKTSETERSLLVKQRIGQDVLREFILDEYDYKCAMCDADSPKVLRASHIIPWSKREETRLDPRNVILLCGLHDLAFENGFITIASDYTIRISKTSPGLESVLQIITNQKLRLTKSKEFYPLQEYLAARERNQV